MSIDTCHACGTFVNTDEDADCYYCNPEHLCICESCREKEEIINKYGVNYE